MCSNISTRLAAPSLIALPSSRGGAKKFSFTFDGEQHIHDAVAAGKGVLLLTAHVGNWEAAGQLLSRVKCPINVTGFDKEIPAIRAVLDRSAKQHFKLIPLTGAPPTPSNSSPPCAAANWSA
jgi:lauroyl/myristoyl acyltransferase